MDKRIDDLLDDYLSGRCTEAERQMLESHYLRHLDAHTPVPSEQQVNDSFVQTHRQIWEEIQKSDSPKTKSKRLVWYWAAAAAVFLAMGTTVSLWNLQQYKVPAQSQLAQDVAPGGSRATLTFSDGGSMMLDGNKSGIVMSEDIVYEDGSILLQDSSSTIPNTKKVTLETPLGGTYQVVLSDGTKVWLNAASKIQYPQVFGSDRVVQLSGEAYFEVAHQGGKPFRVITDQQAVEVLGTKFNVRSYANQLEKTTLLEGRVNVSATALKVSQILKPGQQLALSTSGIRLMEVNAMDVVAWKDDILVFQQEDIRDIIKDIERWYDVDIVVKRDLAHLPKLTGEIPRNVTLNEFLKALKLHYNLIFHLEGRRVTIQ